MENKSSTTRGKGFLAEWLEKIQQESWQLELLISGLALYGVYSGIERVEDFYTFSKLNSSTPQLTFVLSFAHALLFLGWRIFFYNLLIHVILRGLWIASIGLRYVSDEIDFDELDYAPRYTTYLKEKIGSYDEFIERLEKLCSVIFAFTFLVFLLLISLSIFTFVFAAPFLYKSNYSISELFIPLTMFVYLALGLVVAVDFITLGSIKKIREPWVIKVYTPIFKFYSYLTLSFLYRPILYNFLDQKYTKRFLLLAIPYVIILGGIDSSFTNHANPYLDSDDNLLKSGLLIEDSHYADLLEKRVESMSSYDRKKYLNQNAKTLYLSNYHIKKDQLSFFMMDNRIAEYMSNKFNKEPINKEGVLFNLFLNHENENSDIKQIEEKYSEKYISLHREFSSKRYALGSNLRNSELEKILQPQKDSINKIIVALEIEKRIEIDTYQANYNQEVFDQAVSLVKVKIDSVDYTTSLSCKYFKDQFFGAAGVLCNLYESRLPKGNKIIEFTRMRYDDDAVDSLNSSIIKIPVFIE